MVDLENQIARSSDESVHSIIVNNDNEYDNEYDEPASEDNKFGLRPISRTVSEKVKNEDLADKYLVRWDGDDKENVQLNMSLTRKWLITLVISFCALAYTSLSSSFSMVIPDIIKEFEVTHTVAVLGISLFIFGLGLGPMFLGPLSEFYGRRPMYVIGFSIFFAFQFMTAFGQSLTAILLGRFLSGFFGSAFMTVTAGTISDIFTKAQIGLPMVLFTLTPITGPGLGPLIAGWATVGISWRWSFYIFLMTSGVIFVGIIFLIPETFEPILLSKKAKRLRKETGDENYYAAYDRTERKLFRTVATSCHRPFMILGQDPMMICLCFYSGLLIATLYLFFVAFPLVYDQVYHFEIQYQGMSILGTTVGVILSAMFSAVFLSGMYTRRVVRNDGVHESEFRLFGMMVGGPFIPIGLFIFGWTCYPSVHWIVPIIGGVIFGFGAFMTFNSVIQYTVDAYRQYAASAVSANSFVRSVMAGAFPLFATYMYEGMGFHWASSLLAFVGILMIPSPFIFYKYGKYLRSKSKFAWTD